MKPYPGRPTPAAGPFRRLAPTMLLAIGASMALEGDRLQNPVPLQLGSAVRCSSPAIGELSHRVVSSEGMRR